MRINWLDCYKYEGTRTEHRSHKILPRRDETAGRGIQREVRAMSAGVQETGRGLVRVRPAATRVPCNARLDETRVEYGGGARGEHRVLNDRPSDWNLNRAPASVAPSHARCVMGDGA